MTAAILKALPPLYSTEKVPAPEKIAVAKWFCGGRFSFYAVEGEKDGDDFRMFGYTVSPQGSDCDEFGYTALSELQSVRIMERDMHFQPTKMGELVPSLKE